MLQWPLQTSIKQILLQQESILCATTSYYALFSTFKLLAYHLKDSRSHYFWVSSVSPLFMNSMKLVIPLHLIVLVNSHQR